MEKEIIKIEKDGLGIIIKERKNTNVCAFQVWINVGAVNEKPAEAGISHFIEHMLFKPNKKRKQKPLAEIVEQLGGEVNAFTSYDNTCFHFSSEKTNFLKIAKHMLNAVYYPDFTCEFKSERNVILEEINMYADSNGSILSRKLRESIFKGHSYEKEILGYKKTLEKMTPKTLATYHKKYYSKVNSLIVAVGDFDAEEMYKFIIKNTQTVQKGKKPAEVSEFKPKNFQNQKVEKEIEEILFGYALPGFNSSDAQNALVDIGATILGQGETSRLYKKLVREKQIALSVSSFAYSLTKAGKFMITLQPIPDKQNECIAEIKSEIENLFTNGISDEEFQKAVANIEVGYVLSRETCEGLATKLGAIFEKNKYFDDERAYQDALKNATKEDVMEVLTKIFLSKSSQVWLGSKGAVKSAHFLEIDKKKIKNTELLTKDIFHHQYENGLRLIIKEDKKLPFVCMAFANIAGSGFEEKSESGFSRLTALLRTKGTKNRTAEEISQEVEQMAGGLSHFSGKNSFGVTFDFLASKTEQALNIFEDVLLNPNFPESELELYKKMTLEEIKVEEDHPNSFALKQALAEMFAQHPYAHPLIGDSESISKVSRDDILKFFDKINTPKNQVISIVGDVNITLMKKHIDKIVSAMPIKNKNVEINIPKVIPISVDKYRELPTKKEQARLIIAMNGLKISDNERHAFKIAMNILSSQSGLLFSEIRDKRGLAYSVGPFAFDGIEKGMFAIIAGVSKEKIDEAKSAILNVLDIYTKNGISEFEFENAKRNLIAKHILDMQRYSFVAATMALDVLYGFKHDECLNVAKKINAITLPQLRSVMKQIFAQPKITVVLMPK